MAYREVSRMEYEEVVRRWQAGESQRAIARALGLARNTVAVYIRAASAAPSEDGAAKPVPRRQPGPTPGAAGPAVGAAGGRTRSRSASGCVDEHLQLTRIQELLSQDGVSVTYTTLRRFVRQAGLWKQPRSTVRMAPTAPGEVAEMDFGKLGTLVNPITGNARWSGGCWSCWSTAVTLLLAAAAANGGRHDRGSGGGVALLRWSATRDWSWTTSQLRWLGPDALNPRPTRAFLEYSQARGFLLDPARVRHPKDKPHVEAVFGTHASAGGRAAASRPRRCRQQAETGAARWPGCACMAPPASCPGSCSRMKSGRICSRTLACPTTCRSGAR